MDFIGFIKTCSSFLIACLLAVGVQVFFFSPISPDILEFPPASSSSQQLFPSNSKLQEVIKLGEGLVQSEDVSVDKMGILYTANTDGWIKKLHRNGSWDNWKWIDSKAGLAGITTLAAGGLIVCDLEQGLLKVNEDGVTLLASQVNGIKIRFADNVVEARDGSVYFSVASTKFGVQDWYLDVLEAKPHGQLLKYDPASQETSIVLDNLAFANGVTFSPDQDFLIVCETWKYRCLKYWLKGQMRGKMEIFIDNLPGAPDNINLAPDGTFWIALLELTSRRLKYVHRSKALKHLVATFPGLVAQVHGIYTKAMVAKVDRDGKIIKILEDPTGKVMSFVTSALEFQGHLYLASPGFLIASLLAVGVQVFFFSPISPDILEFPPAYSSSLKFPSNSKLQEVIKLGEGLVQSEDVSVDKMGVLYTSTKDGYQIVQSKQEMEVCISVCQAPNADSEMLDLLEAKPHGLLLKYDPAMEETSILLHDLFFANGVALSPDQEFLVVCETWKKCKEKTEIFVDNLPGAPDNIKLAPDGTFWITLLEDSDQIDGKFTKAMVAKVDRDGKIIKILQDPTGKVMSFVTSALEFQGHLYLTSPAYNFMGKLPL
ncbi:hypothetical protein ACH5RR_003971 [Cinchona calisaya]|uniref:Strictosidine synthase conserved region domain-containing protein n=1 Tax=Cinchona calisaya TaxID=153742 RepID=A0ABD3AW87_9GENT